MTVETGTPSANLAAGVRALAACMLLVLLQACAQAAPAAAHALPHDQVFLTAPGGLHLIVDAATGAEVAQLPAGQVAYRLDGAMRLAEAYLVAPEPVGVQAIRSGLPYRLDRAQGPELGPPPYEVALVPDVASGSPAAILVIRAGDGAVSTYQRGRLVTRANPPSLVGEIRQIGSEAFARSTDGGWTRQYADPSRAEHLPDCRPGPAAVVGSEALAYCADGSQPALRGASFAIPVTAPSALPWELRSERGGRVVLAWPDGTYYLVAPGPALVAHGRAAWTSRPVLSPDGGRLYYAEASGVDWLDTASGRTGSLLTAPGVASVALSPDGARLFVLTVAALAVFASDGSRLAEHRLAASTIDLVAGV